MKIVDDTEIQIEERINGNIHTVMFKYLNKNGDIHFLTGMSWNEAGRERKRPRNFTIKNRIY
jgi:hypothetical protein